MENAQTNVGEMVTTNNQIPQSQMMLMHFDPFTYSFFELEETKAGKEENLASLFDVAGSKENTMTNMGMSTCTCMEDKKENIMDEMEATNQEFPQPRMMLSDFDPFQYNFFQPE
ncbi:PREDICTED: uncharacterized protein LOC109347165 [Lupinus angustifolius]|uniref:uncharacterized protein LOC109347165 n=1 Tax=Lupinus angustifolius TaxID=3871 RepID=UPI00092E673B|nr:PREDICTED: uncharacterized protein LOC109347165 [Lupinus angustifolius]